MNWRRLIALAAAGALSLLASAATAADRYTLGTNPQGTIYYTIGGGIAAALQEKLGKQVTVQPYTGSSVYLPLIAAGEVSMGLNSSLDLGGARAGEFGEPMKDLRVLARVWPLTVALVARNDLGITKISELEGKRVVTELSALKAMSTLSKTILELSGLSVDDVEAVSVAGLGPGMEQLTENNLDATLIAVGIPLTQQAHASIPGGIRYLDIDGENATSEKADELYSGLYLTDVEPSGRLPEVTEPVTVAGFDVFLTVSTDMPEEDATAILEAFYESLPQLKKDYPPLGGAAQDKMSMPTNTVPYHEAAVAFFKSKDMWSEKNEARQQALTQ
ncbi:TAXI family TRAP transporter solute-binding subunit [Chelativorans salis]|uniref:TAXI family TRAP transporter solute-binding subunit n=1 Tax=Chelativorans salis TaxID=2978478 RepID=A0ABT2LI28_9HYPH|nr:TAXI family TRAP transporter solute-binding subunit [Chelativorans sp. EGI FJ00035]MCT7374123.1 TAXI family TRAP transporter solute-binding subunit [Chelativorans sp. EGI FJ00035]